MKFKLIIRFLICGSAICGTLGASLFQWSPLHFDETWPVSVTFNTGWCSLSTVQEISVYRPGSCNPIPVGKIHHSNSWTSICDSSHIWQVNWFSDWFESAACTEPYFDMYQEVSTPLECVANSYNLLESFYCMNSTIPRQFDPTSIEGRHHWKIVSSMHSSGDCGEESLFSYRYLTDKVCITSEQASITTHIHGSDSILIRSYRSTGCGGRPVKHTKVTVGDCVPFTPAGPVAANAESYLLLRLIKTTKDLFEECLENCYADAETWVDYVRCRLYNCSFTGHSSSHTRTSP